MPCQGLQQLRFGPVQLHHQLGILEGGGSRTRPPTRVIRRELVASKLAISSVAGWRSGSAVDWVGAFREGSDAVKAGWAPWGGRIPSGTRVRARLRIATVDPINPWYR